VSLWETYESARDDFYGWIAVEMVAVMSLRKYLIK
jgi:NADPH-dependent ferric siderophore reductase